MKHSGQYWFGIVLSTVGNTVLFKKFDFWTVVAINLLVAGIYFCYEYIRLDRHLVYEHGYLYIDDVPTAPPDNKHPWTLDENNKWVCLDKNCPVNLTQPLDKEQE